MTENNNKSKRVLDGGYHPTRLTDLAKEPKFEEYNPTRMTTLANRKPAKDQSENTTS